MPHWHKLMKITSLSPEHTYLVEIGRVLIEECGTIVLSTGSINPTGLYAVVELQGEGISSNADPTAGTLCGGCYPGSGNSTAKRFIHCNH